MGSILSSLEEIIKIVVIVAIACLICACMAALCACVIGIPVHFTRKKKKDLKTQYRASSSALGKSGNTRSAGEVWNSTGYDREAAAQKKKDDQLALVASVAKAATGTAFIPGL